MNPVIRYMKPIMLVSGLLTSTTLGAAVAPGAILQSTFGESLEGPLAELLVRNWGVLVGLVGLMLIYAAFDRASRRIALIIASVSKVAFIALVLSAGTTYLPYGAGFAVVVDTLMVVLFTIYLATVRSAVVAQSRADA